MAMVRWSLPVAGVLSFSLATALTGCDRGSGSAGEVAMRDSAGIRIVESGTPVLGAAAWTIGTTPTVEIGATEDSGQALHYVEGALRLSDGRIVIADGGRPALRWFDAEGKYIHGTGRFGQGPGEFDGGEGAVWIYALWPLPGDSVATWEHSRRRMQVFDPQGRYVRAMTIDLPPDMPPAAYPQISGRMADGLVAILADPRETDRPLGVVFRDSASFLRYSPDGKFDRRLVRLPAFTRFVVEMPGPRTGRIMRTSYRPPFSPPFSSWPHGDRLYYGGSVRFEIAMYDTSGALRSLIRRTGPLRPVTAEVIAEYRRTQLATAGSDPVRLREAEENLKRLPFPDTIPAYRQVRVDREGMLWVQEYVVPGVATARWSVFDRDGRWLTDVPIPVGWQIQDIGRDYILTLEAGELDVERVRLHSLSRDQQPPR